MNNLERWQNMTALISNPPYNMKWEHPFFAQSQDRFIYGVPPENNANYAFIQSALATTNHCVFLLPNSVLSTNQVDEKTIKQSIVEDNYLVAVIQLPERMFESTSIPTCMLVFDKNKETQKILMIDLTDKAEQETRDQNGQYGETNTKRTYHKTMNVLSEEMIRRVTQLVRNPKDEDGLSSYVSLEQVKNNDFNLNPRRYFEIKNDYTHRKYADIVTDMNHIIDLKNETKLVINEKAAKDLGVYDLIKQFQGSAKLNKEIAKIAKEEHGLKLKNESFVSLSRNKELKFEVKDWDKLPELFVLMVGMWAQTMRALNNEENRYLVEYKDAILNDMFKDV